MTYRSATPVRPGLKTSEKKTVIFADDRKKPNHQQDDPAASHGSENFLPIIKASAIH
jgi:hypothetical protein